MSRVLHLRNLSQRERLAVILLRRGCHGSQVSAGMDSAMAAAFSALAPIASHAGYVVLTPEAPFINADEQKLLACLTLLQRHGARQWTACDIELDCELTQALRTCAQLLEVAGHHLCHRNAIRVLETIGTDNAGMHLPKCDALLPTANGPSGRTGTKRSLEARILQLVADQGTVATHDLHALGATSRMVRNMRRKGMLHRIRHGIYTLGKINYGFSGLSQTQASPA